MKAMTTPPTSGLMPSGVEMVILPLIAKFYLWTEPLVAGAWMGLAVKSDGGAIASGAITDAQARTNLRTLIARLREALPNPDRYLAIDAQCAS